MSNRYFLKTCLLTTGSLFLALSCGSDDVPDEISVSKFSIGTQVATPDTSENFVAFTNDLDRSDTLTLEEAIEAGSAGGVFAPGDGSGTFFTAESGGKLQRWQATSTDSDNPTVVRDGSLSFSAAGLTDFFPTASHIQFIDQTKAYVMNSSSGEVIIWDPSELEITGHIDIPELSPEIDGAVGSFSLSGVHRGSELIFTYNYFADPEHFTAESYLVVIDTEDDSVQVDHTSDCGDLAYGMAAENGDVYWASSFFNAAIHHINDQVAPAPCLLRVPKGSTEFEETSVTLTELADGRPAGNIVPAGGNKALMRVYHEEEVPIEADTDSVTVVVAPAWRWWSLDLETLEAAELSDSTLGTGQTIHYQVEDDSYVISLASDYSTSTIERVVPDAAPVPGLTVTGVARFGIVKN